MHAAPATTPRTLATLAIATGALVALALFAVACTPQAVSTGPEVISPVPTSTVAPSTLPTEVPVASSGPIVVPATGTALRAAILNAASAGLGVSGKITVIQLFSQDTAAVGDIQPATGSRMFFAVVGGPDEWQIAWSAPFGSALATLDALETAAPLVSPDLAGRLVWNKKIVKPAAKAPTLSSFRTFAMTSAKSMAGATYTGTFTITGKIAKDSKGVWWGNALAEPSVSGLEPIGVWGKYSAGKWTGEIADFSGEDAAAAFFPAGVLSKLQLP